MTPIFTYGDRVRRNNGGPVLTIQDITSIFYNFSDGTFALIADQDCYTLVEKASGYFRVAGNLDGMPLDKYLDHGYETREEFADALRRLTERWGGRTGRRRDERHKFLLLQFPDTPGSVPDEAWLPLYMLTPCPAPPCPAPEQQDPAEEELAKAFGFD